MRNFEGFLADVKRAALEAVRASKPCSVTYGTVTATEPLEIAVDQKLTLRASQLLLTYAVRGELALQRGEKVLLLRADGGQQYIVLDRVEVDE